MSTKDAGGPRLHVVSELLTNIKRSCIRGRNVADMERDKNFVATCDHIQDLAQQALRALKEAQS